MPRLSTARAQQQQSKALSAGNGTAEVTLGDSRQDIGTIEVPRNGTMRWINSGTRDLQLQFTRPGVEEDGSSSSNGMAPGTFELTVPGGGQSVKHFSRTGLYSYACETPHITGQVRVIARDKPSLLPPSIKVPTTDEAAGDYGERPFGHSVRRRPNAAKATSNTGPVVKGLNLTNNKLGLKGSSAAAQASQQPKAVLGSRFEEMNYAFHPNKLRVPLNTTIVFVLADQTGAPEHQPVGECAATGKGVFRGPLMDRTGTFEFRHTFREPGDVRVRCEVVRDMQATITVTDAPAAAAAAATAAAATAETAVTDGDADVQLCAPERLNVKCTRGPLQLYVTTAGASGCCLSPRRLTLCEGQRVTICHRGGGTHRLTVTRRGARAPLWSHKPLDGVRTRKFCLPPLAPAELCAIGDCGIVDGRHQRFTRNDAGETAWEPVAQRLTLDTLGSSAQPSNGDSSRGRGGVAGARGGVPESVAALLRTVDSSAAAAAAAHGGGGSGALSAAEAHQLGHEARAASIVASMRQQPGGGGGGGIWAAAHGKWPSRLITPAAAAAAAAAARAPSGSLSLMHMMENVLAQGRGGGGGVGAGGGSAAAAAAGGDEAAAAAGRKKKKKAKKKGGGAATGEEDASATTGAAALDAGASQTPVLIVATYKGLKPSRVMLVPGQPAQVVLGKRESSETQVRTISVTPVSKTKGVPAPEPSSFQLSHEKPRQGIRFPAEPGEYVLYDNVSKSRATVTVMSAAEAAAAAGGGGSGGAGDARSSEAAMEQLLKEEEKAAKPKPGKKRKQQRGATAAAVAAAPDATATPPAAATTAAEGEAATEESEAAADGETADEWAWPETQSGKAEPQEPQEPPSSDADAETETTEDDSAAAAEPATRAASPPPAAAAAPGGAAAHAQQRAPVVVALRSVEALPPFCASAVAYVRLGQPINPQYPPPAHFSAAFVEGEGAAVRCSLTSFSVSAGGPPREIRVFRVRASGDVGEAPEAAATVSPEGPHSCVFLLMAPGVYRVVDTRNGRSVEVTSAVPDAAPSREFEWERSTKQFPVSQASRAEAQQRIAATTAAAGGRSGGSAGAAAEPTDRRSMEEHDWALAVALHEEEEAAAGAAAGRPAEAAESWELASRTKSKQKRSGISGGGGGSNSSISQAQQQQQQRMHVRRPSGEMAAPVGVRGGFVAAAAAGAAASGRSSGGAGGSSGGVVNSAAWPALESRTVVRVSSAPLPSVRPLSDLSNPAVAPPASEPRQQAAAAAAPDAAQPAAVDRERSQSPAAAADAAQPATVGSPAAAAANAAQPATASSRERSQSPSAAAEPASSATAQSGSSAGVAAAAAPMPAAPQSPPPPPQHEQADAAAAAPIIGGLVSAAEAGSDAQHAEVAEQPATPAPTAPGAAAEPAAEAADASIAAAASPPAEPTAPGAIDSPPLPAAAEASSVPSPLPLPLSSVIAFGDFTSPLTASPTFAALPPPDDSAADTVLAEGQWVLPPPTPTTTPVVAAHLSAEAAGAAPAEHGAEDGSQDRHAVAADDGRRMGQQLLAMLQPDAAADAYGGGDGGMGYADVGAQYGDGSGGFMDGSGGVVYGDGSAHHMYDDGSGSMLYGGGGGGGGMVYSDGSGGVAYGYDDGTGAVVYSHGGSYMDHSGGAYYGGGGGMVADSWEDRYGAPLPPLPPQHPPLPPPSAFELEHSEFLRQRWEAFQERFAAGYDVLPSGKHVPIVWVTLSPQ
ncbi:hypothetical protein JKP88DRAFT_336765 [Tribonema minus]|uniref:Uncharacterized protein n=1 Tax=Tribonema minus TaxID=303371 RepID=A0A835YSZ2_9STRA|nr:hypothetical protein JKP88DRAFT_336765 [Tribonema minus]